MSRYGMYEEMVKHSPALWTIWPDTLVTCGRTRPTREELIAGFMSIPEYDMRRRPDKPGYEAVAGPTYRNRQDAERAVAGYCEPTERAA